MDIGPHTAASDPTEYPFGPESANGEPRFAPPEQERGGRWKIELLASGARPDRFFTLSISWSESLKQIERSTFTAVMDETLGMVRAGVPDNKLAEALVALHQRENGTDGHLYIPQVDLETGRPISFVTWDRDKYLFWDLADKWNLSRRWTSPRDGATNFLKNPTPELTDRERQSRWVRIDRLAKRVVRFEGCDERGKFLKLIEQKGIRIISTNEEGIEIQDADGQQFNFVGGKYAANFDYRGIERRIAAAREIWWGQAPERLP